MSYQPQFNSFCFILQMKHYESVYAYALEN